MIVMAECEGPDLPGVGDVVYFEIPEAIDPVTSLRTEVHLFLFDTLPGTPAHGLNALASAESLKCETRGVENDLGGLELVANWEIRDRGKPVLRKVRTPFRPSPAPGMQQVRVRVSGEAIRTFEYLFDSDHTTWRPLLDTEEFAGGAGEEAMSLELSGRRQREAWYRVNDLVRVEESERMAGVELMALTEMAPDSGNYILMSLRRRLPREGSAGG